VTATLEKQRFAKLAALATLTCGEVSGDS